MEFLPSQEPRQLKIVEKCVKPCRNPASVISCSQNNFGTRPIRKILFDLGPVHKETQTVAFILEDVLTREECQKLIDMAEETTYTHHLPNSGDGDRSLAPGYRDCSRLVIDDAKFAQIIFSRIVNFLPATFKEETLLGIHDRLRFLRYDKGSRFAPHVDGPGNCGVSNCALITLEIYLNDNFEGAETTFLYEEDGGGFSRTPVKPKVGSVLLFQHELLHEGLLLKSGSKYTVWADVVYTKTKIEERSPLVLDLEYFIFDEITQEGRLPE